MKLNVGSIDRWVRIALGLAIGAAGLYFESWFGLIGLVPLGTALAGWCPLYVVLGISTCGLRSEGSST
jgi:hypothetical protein